MTILDILLLIALCWYGFRGLKNGLIYELASIVALVLGCWFAYNISDSVAMLITGKTFVKPVAMTLTFAIVVFLVHLFAKLCGKIIKLIIPAAVDHIFGLLFGIAKVLVFSSVLLFIIQDIDKREILLKKNLKEKSVAYQYTEPIIPHALGWVSSHIKT